MMLTNKQQLLSHFITQRKSILLRGVMMILLGLFLIVMTLAQVQVQVMSLPKAGWMPLVAILLLNIGLLEAIDAFISRHSKEFFITLQLAILDSVTGFMLLYELDNALDKLSLLIAAYLMYKGFFRIIAPLSVDLPQAKITIAGGLISVILGIMVWQGWPSSALWFQAFCISFDITLRGCALSRLALWLNSMAKTDPRDIKSLL